VADIKVGKAIAKAMVLSFRRCIFIKAPEEFD